MKCISKVGEDTVLHELNNSKIIFFKWFKRGICMNEDPMQNDVTMATSATLKYFYPCILFCEWLSSMMWQNFCYWNIKSHRVIPWVLAICMSWTSWKMPINEVTGNLWKSWHFGIRLQYLDYLACLKESSFSNYWHKKEVFKWQFM